MGTEVADAADGQHQPSAAARRKACVECRQQKIRCDVEQVKTAHEACTRCKKMDLKCIVQPTATRNLRKTKAEMRRELDDLRRLVQQDGSTSAQDEQASSLGNDSTLDSLMRDGSGRNGDTERAGDSSDRTTSRALDGYTVDAKKIDDCFSIYFKDYHPLLPILEEPMSPRKPNDCYQLSPFLFWSIVVTGSRKYAKDDGILDQISLSITPLAFSSMAVRSTPIPVIQGLLILCTWRLPTNSMFKDMTHVLSGAAVHLAMQIGLHVTGIGQDFARTPLETSQTQILFRANLWAHCMNVSIRTSCAEGIPPLVNAEPYFTGDARDKADILNLLPTGLRFTHRLYNILVRAMNTMSKANLKSCDSNADLLGSLIGIYDTELRSIAVDATSDLETFQLSCVRLHILTFHFFADPTRPDAEAFIRLYLLCINLVKAALALRQNISFPFVSHSFIDRSIGLAGMIVFRLMRSSLAQHLDLGAGAETFREVLELGTAASMREGDIASRTAVLMSKLYGSSKLFRSENGAVEALQLRLRSRLSMSLTFDMFWYCREEFGNMANPYKAVSVEADKTKHNRGIATNTAYNLIGSGSSVATPDLASVPTDPARQSRPAEFISPLPQMQSFALYGDINGSAPMSDDLWGDQTSGMPMLMSQYPDYDWAAGIDFSLDWGNVFSTNPARDSISG